MSAPPIDPAVIEQIRGDLNALRRRFNPLVPADAEAAYGDLLAGLAELDQEATVAADSAGRHDVVVLIDGTLLRVSAIEGEWVTGPVSESAHRAYVQKWGQFD